MQRERGLRVECADNGDRHGECERYVQSDGGGRPLREAHRPDDVRAAAVLRGCELAEVHTSAVQPVHEREQLPKRPLRVQCVRERVVRADTLPCAAISDDLRAVQRPLRVGLDVWVVQTRGVRAAAVVRPCAVCADLERRLREHPV